MGSVDALVRKYLQAAQARAPFNSTLSISQIPRGT